MPYFSTTTPGDAAATRALWRRCTTYAALVLFAACSGGESATGTPTPPPPPVSVVGAVVVSPASASVTVGSTVALAATVRDASGNEVSGKTVQWTSGNVAVATVSTSGTVTGLTAGTVTVTASVDGKSGAASLTVISVPVSRTLVVGADSARPSEIITLQPEGLTGALPDSVTGFIGTTEFRAIRLTDTTLAGYVPMAPAGRQDVRFVIAGRTYVGQVTMRAPLVIADPSATATLLFDRLGVRFTALDRSLASGDLNSLDTAGVRRYITNGRASVASARSEFNSLSADEKSGAIRVIAAQLAAVGLDATAPVALRTAAAQAGVCDAVASFATCTALEDARLATRALAIEIGLCSAKVIGSAGVTAILGGILGGATAGVSTWWLGGAGAAPGVVAGIKVGAGIGAGLGAGWCVTDVLTKLSEVAKASVNAVLVAVGVEPQQFQPSTSSIRSATTIAPQDFIVGVAKPIAVYADISSISAADASGPPFVAALVTEFNRAATQWNTLRTRYPSLDLPPLALPASPRTLVRKKVPGTYLSVGSITPSVVTSTASGDSIWRVTFLNPPQGDDLNLSFNVRLIIPNLPDQQRPLTGLLRPARYTVRSLAVSPIMDSVRVRGANTVSWTARDSSGDVLSDSLLLGRRPAWTSADPAIATVINCCGVVSGVAMGTTAITARLEEGSSVQILKVLLDVTGTYALKSLNGKAIPGETYSDTAYVINTSGGSLTLRADYSFSFGVSAIGRNRSNGATYNESSGGGGTYTVSGNTISFFVVPKTGENLVNVGSASLVGNRLSLSFSARDADGQVVSGVAVVDR